MAIILVIILLMTIGGYSIVKYWWLLMAIILMTIGGYFISGYWWLLMTILLMTIGGYFINGYSKLYYDYWRLLYYKLLLVILCYSTTIGEYCFISYCWLFYVILGLLATILL